ncbi:MAG: hypothetical protein ABI955_12705 [Nitrospirota bacterium]
MIPLRKVVGILSCSVLLCLALSNAARSEHAPSPSDVMKTDSVSDRQGYQSDADKQKHVDNKNDSPGDTILKGELVRVENANYFVKMAGGKEVRIHTDKTTEMMGTVKKGDQIEAKVNDKHHALSIRSAQ